MSIKEKISGFKKSANQIRGRRGLLTSSILFIITFTILVSLENLFWYDRTIRMIMFYGLIFLTLLSLILFAVIPFLRARGLISDESDEEAAKHISSKIPELGDHLINYLQLQTSESELAKAAIGQKDKKLRAYNFTNAVERTANKKYFKVLILSLLTTIGFAFINPPIITQGANRLIRHNVTFEEPVPFQFIILNDSLVSFKNEPFELRIKLLGKDIPTNTQIIMDESILKMKNLKNGEFHYSFRKLSAKLTFVLEASGFKSKEYTIELVNKPVLNLMSIELDFPNYTKKKNEKISYDGNLSIPSGTKVKWNISTANSNLVTFYIQNDTLRASREKENFFSLEKKIYIGGNYSIELKNDFSSNESLISYNIQTVTDEFPSIEVEYAPDTTFFKFVVIIGEIEDDYGFQKLNLIQEINGIKKQFPVKINKHQKLQKFYTEWFTDTAKVASGENITLYLEIQDNDEINGYKTTRSNVFHFKKPSLSDISEIIDSKSDNTENQIQKSLNEIGSLREKLKELSNRIKSEKETNWQNEKLFEKSLEHRRKLEKMLDELKEKHNNLIRANQNFEQSDELQKKSIQLQKLIENLTSDETKQLYEELQKLLETKTNGNELRDKLNEINRNENRLYKDLERTKELFKRMKLEVGLERISQQLDSLAEMQMKLSKDNLDSVSIKKQEILQKEFEKLTEDLDVIEKLNQELKKPEPLSDFQADEKIINQEFNKAEEQMKKGNAQKSKQSQKNAGEQMKKMSKSMQLMQNNMQSEELKANIEDLRKVLDDLIKLSYRQESILDNFKNVNQSDPRFIILSQNQIKLKDDLVVIEDSLMALASRMINLSNFITKEIEEINYQMNEAVTQIKDRQKNRAASHQQFSMTSMNNLSLLLNDMLENMQMTMSDANGKGNNWQPKDLPIPSLKEMQKKLGEQIQQIGQKKGGELSEELVRLAIEQEIIRQKLQELQKQLEGKTGNKKLPSQLSQIAKMMEENEIDLVNKRISRQLIERQKQITTNMLQAEEALREQGRDFEKKGETAKKQKRIFPPNFEEYLENRKKEIELLRKVPIELKPFYKQEVNEYFIRLSESNL